MFALSIYSPETEAALRDGLDSEFGRKGEDQMIFAQLIAESSLVRFDWPDWPVHRSRKCATLVNRFHAACRELQPVKKGCDKWKAVFSGSVSDPNSAAEIGKRFEGYFDQGVAWVRCEKSQKGLVQAEIAIAEVGTVALQLSWHRCDARALTDANKAEAKALNFACNEVLNWGSAPMESILEPLRQQMQKRYGDCFKGLYVFGSYAQPDAGVELPNDLDVALVLSDFEDPHIERFSRIASDLLPKRHMLISVTPILESVFVRGEGNLVRLISQEAVRVA